MNLEQWKRYLRRDGWLLAALVLTAALCLVMGASEQSPAASEEELRLARVLSAMEGAGEVDVALHYDEEDRPCSAIVVAGGADSAAVRIRLTTAVTTLLGVDSSRVAVYPKGTGGH